MATLHVSEEVEESLGKFVRAIYGNEMMSSVNNVRKKMLLQKFDSEKKINQFNLTTSLLRKFKAPYQAIEWYGIHL